MKPAVLSLALLCLASAAWAGGDTITLRDGKSYHGDILFTNDSDYVVSIDGKPVHIPIADIQKIEFGPR